MSPSVLRGVKLVLLVGEERPAPLPPALMEDLTELKVTVASDKASGFQIGFKLERNSPLGVLFQLMPRPGAKKAGAKGGPPLTRVVVIAVLSGLPEVLMDGVVTNIETKPSEGGGPATLTVTGEDLTRLMDFKDESGKPFPNTSPDQRVTQILRRYAGYGIIPAVVPPLFQERPLAARKFPAQKGKDLEYIKKLAEEVGYVFFLEPGPAPRKSIAYWGPEPKTGLPQPALSVNMDAFTNVESLRFTVKDADVTQPVVLWRSELLKRTIPIPIPNVNPFNPPLGAVPPVPRTRERLKEVGGKSAIQAALLGMTTAAKSAENVFAEGTLDVLRYGRPLKARRLVGVRGAETPFNGLFYVQSVTHEIKPGEYKQNFRLSRRGLMPTAPRVPV